MKITRTISSLHPEKCSMTVRGWFGREIGRIKYADYGIEGLGGKKGYFILVKGQMVGAATDFYHACDQLLNDLKIIKTECV